MCVCVEEKTAGEKRGIINFSSSAVEMANEFCSHPVRALRACLVPEYLHHSTSRSRPLPARLSRDLQRLGGNIEPPAIDGDDDTSRGRARITWPVFCDHPSKWSPH
jgi:hypothetical protein